MKASITYFPSSIRLAMALFLSLSSMSLLAAQTDLANAPLVNSTITTVKPNLMFIMDDSGSMGWEYMPDRSSSRGISYGYYGARSSQCNQVYYNPDIEYLPPVNADGTSFADAVFSAAKSNGFNGSSSSVDLRSDFRAVSHDYVGDSYYERQTAYYYTYSGSQLTPVQKNYLENNQFVSECEASSSSAVARAVFSKVVLVSGNSNSYATISVQGGNTSSVTGILLEGAEQIMSGTAAADSSNNTVADRIVDKINDCTSIQTGNCSAVGGHGYTATRSGSTITLRGIADDLQTIAIESGKEFTINLFASSIVIDVTGSGDTSVTSIVLQDDEGITREILSEPTNDDTSSDTVAARVASSINACKEVMVGNCSAAHGYMATAVGNTVAINGLDGTISSVRLSKFADSKTFVISIYPATDSAKLTNFANWYSYYRDRVAMMKTSAGRAFSSLGSNYRVGLMEINSANPLLPVGTFEGQHRIDWYEELYNINPSGSTPLRRSLSDAGRYFANELSGADPIQYSCQQNFAILSTDGYWNSSAGYKLNGSSSIGNQDGDAEPPMHDGQTGGSTVTTRYERTRYFTQGRRLWGRNRNNCRNNTVRVIAVEQERSCSITTVDGVAGPEECTNWGDSGSNSYYSGFSNNRNSCVDQDSVTVPYETEAVAVSTSTAPDPDGNPGTSNTLADVAMYYYKNDLRTSALGNCSGVEGVDVCANEVFVSGGDNNTQQHMTTFTLGLGANGWMQYSNSYLSDTTGDFYSVKTQAIADSSVNPPICKWMSDGDVCTWPSPSSDSVANIDDLWHAAVNGRGAYFSATDPRSLAEGLSGALSGISIRRGAAAAAATSTLNPIQGNNDAFVASYTTVTWTGNLEARGINTDTGVVNKNAKWCVEDVPAGVCSEPGEIVYEESGSTTTTYCVTPNVVSCNDGQHDEAGDCWVRMATTCTGTMNSMVSDAGDSRNIKIANSSGNGLVAFTYANLTPTQQRYFDVSHIATMTQWTTLTATQQMNAAGDNLVNYLRGQSGFEQLDSNPFDSQVFRARESVLGDALESQPAFIAKPTFSYPYLGYSAFVTAQSSRAGTVYMGTNDGMMHAFNAETGVERWGYIPSMILPNLWRLADSSYATQHQHFVNGNPTTSDICISDCDSSDSALPPVWKTILVAGLNGGGRGFYALDITDPDNPGFMWEFSQTDGGGSVQDADLGYSYAQPIITRKQDGTWVVLVTSGYNNVSPGNGKGYLYVLNAATGAIISKISTNTGSTETPSGLAKIVGWNAVPAGNEASYVYGGDLQGNVWRFDINSSEVAAIGTGSVMKFTQLFSDTLGLNPQPVTTTPELGLIAGKRIVFIVTGQYLGTSDLTTTQTQSIYAIKDDVDATIANPRNFLVEQTLSPNPDATASRVGSGHSVNFYTQQGWFVDLPDSGERVNVDPELVQGVLLVASIVPTNSICSPGGYGWLNFFDYKTGTPIDTESELASTKYEATIVGLNVMYIQGVPLVSVVTSTRPTPELDEDVEFPATAARFSGKRVMWRELVQ